MTKKIDFQTKSKSPKLAALAILGLAGTVVVTGGINLQTPTAQAEISQAGIKAVKPYANAPESFADLVAKVRPSVVSIFVKGKKEKVAQRPNRRFGQEREQIPPFSRPRPDMNPFRDFFGGRPFGRQPNPNPQPKNAQGSGFIITEDGYVVTNHHVIKDGKEFKVTLDGGEELDARLIGSDERTDLALLKIKDKRKFSPVPMANNKARVGDWVLAVGNPFGLGGTVTAGIVSAHGRSVGQSPYDFLQIDAAVNRGNSGGPAFNLKGEVVGVNTAIYSPSGGNVGIAFAIPANVVNKIVTDLKKAGSVKRGWLGINIQNLDDDLADGFDLDGNQGALVTRLIQGGPAIKSDLKERDVIVEVNGEKVKDVRDLMRKIGEISPNETVDMVVMRRGAKKNISIKLGAFPTKKQLAALQRNEPALSESNKELEGLGLSLAPARTKGKGKEGVVITEIDPDSSASRKGLKVGDVIVEMNGLPVNTPSEVSAEIAAARKRNKQRVVVLLKDSHYYIALTLKKDKK